MLIIDSFWPKIVAHALVNCGSVSWPWNHLRASLTQESVTFQHLNWKVPIGFPIVRLTVSGLQPPERHRHRLPSPSSSSSSPSSSVAVEPIVIVVFLFLASFLRFEDSTLSLRFFRRSELNVSSFKRNLQENLKLHQNTFVFKTHLNEPSTRIYLSSNITRTTQHS